MQLSRPLVCLFATVCLSAVEAQDDAVLSAMDAELGRATTRLKLPPSGPPYYVAYTIREQQVFHVSAAFGGLSQRSRSKSRSLDTDVRVGDYVLDSSAAGGSPMDFHFAASSTGLTVEDDQLALRREIWLATDQAYKAAIEDLEAKKAALQQKQIEDRPDDFARATPAVGLRPRAELAVDEERWASRLRRLSAVFRDYPRIQKSAVFFSAEAHTRWFVNSEGFRHREGRTECGIAILAAAQADDGMRLSDGEVFTALAADQLADDETLERAARGLASRLTELCSAPVVDSYRGPVLFEGQAAAEFWAQLLAPHLGNPQESLDEERQSHLLKDRLGQRVAASFLSIVDDPTLRELGGQPMLGGYDFDDDGVPAQRIELVAKGVLKTFCASRRPSRKVKASNGHSRGGSGSTSILLVSTDKPSSLDELRGQLVELGKEEDLKHVLVVRRLGNSLTSILDASSMFSLFSSGAGGGLSLSAPVLCYRIGEDGKEQLVRGARFSGLNLRVLRDVVAAGDDSKPWLVAHGMSEGAHLVTPSILVKEIEVREPAKQAEKPPALAHPYFDR